MKRFLAILLILLAPQCLADEVPVNVAASVTFGPAISSTDGVSRVTGHIVTEISGIWIKADGSTQAITGHASDSTGTNRVITEISNGMYAIALLSGDLDVRGPGQLVLQDDDDDFLEIVQDIKVLETGYYAAKYTSGGFMLSDVREWLGETVATPTTNGVPEVDVTHWIGTAAATPTTAGVPEVDLTHWLGTAAATPTIAGVPEVDLTHWLGTASATPTVAGVPEVDVTHIGGSSAGTANLLANYNGEGYAEHVKTLPVASVTDQTHFEIDDVGTNGKFNSANMPVGMRVLLRNDTTTADVSQRYVTAYDAATGIVTIDRAPDFTLATGDFATFLATTGLRPLLTGFAQGTSTTTNIVLDSALSLPDGYLANCTVKLIGGTGAGQSRLISAYTGSTDTAALVNNWTTAPDATTLYEIVNGQSFVSAMGTNVLKGTSIETGAISAGKFSTGAITDAVLANDALGQAPPQNWSVMSITGGGHVFPQGVVLSGNATIGTVGNDATHIHLPFFTYGDDEINGYQIVIYDNSAAEYHRREITDWVNATKLAEVATLPFTPELGVDLYWLLASQAPAAGSVAAMTIASGTAQAGSSTTIQLEAAENFVADDILTGNIVEITSGQGIGQSRVITAYDNATDTATVFPAWITSNEPASGSGYAVIAGNINVATIELADPSSALSVGAGGLTALATGTAQATLSDSTHIQLAASHTFGDDILNGAVAKIINGTGVGQSRAISDYVGATDLATVYPAWTTAPDASSEYEVIDGSVNVALIELLDPSDTLAASSSASGAGELQATTIATLASQTSFTLTAGSSDDDAYNNMIIVVEDAVTAEQKAVGVISDYTGASKTVTLREDPGIFTMAVGDTATVLAISPDALTILQRVGIPSPTLADDIAGLSTAASPNLLQTTTIATLASQTSFTLSAGSADDDAYNDMVAIITDQVTSSQKAVGDIADYDGATRTVTLRSDPGIFTMATGDAIDILAIEPGQSITTQVAAAQRTWNVINTSEGFRSPNIVNVNPVSGTQTFMFDLTNALNPGTSIQSVSSVADSQATLTIENERIHTDFRRALFDITAGMASGVTHTITITFTTNDSQTIAIEGTLRVQ